MCLIQAFHQLLYTVTLQIIQILENNKQINKENASFYTIMYKYAWIQTSQWSDFNGDSVSDPEVALLWVENDGPYQDFTFDLVLSPVTSVHWVSSESWNAWVQNKTLGPCSSQKLQIAITAFICVKTKTNIYFKHLSQHNDTMK